MARSRTGDLIDEPERQLELAVEGPSITARVREGAQQFGSTVSVAAEPRDESLVPRVFYALPDNCGVEMREVKAALQALGLLQ